MPSTGLISSRALAALAAPHAGVADARRLAARLKVKVCAARLPGPGPLVDAETIFYCAGDERGLRLGVARVVLIRAGRPYAAGDAARLARALFHG